jgi:hypothetical protein
MSQSGNSQKIIYQQFNQNRLLHMTQAILVKLLIIKAILKISGRWL